MGLEHLPTPIQNLMNPPKPELPKINSFILGFGHRARSGKDTAVNCIVNARQGDVDVRSYSFARVLKEEVNRAAEAAGSMKALFNPEMEYYQSNGNFIKLPEWVVYDPEPDMSDPLCPYGKQRLLLQFWGTEYRRAVDPDYWVRGLANIIAREQPEVALISDVRFKNEVEFVQAHGAAVRIDRPGLPPLRGAAGVHPSELALADMPDYEWDLVIKNDSSLEDFQNKIVRVFDNMMADIPRKMRVVQD